MVIAVRGERWCSEPRVLESQLYTIMTELNNEESQPSSVAYLAPTPSTALYRNGHYSH